jgi:4-hydroxy-3-methylbut-2-enyl diphosphate reductase
MGEAQELAEYIRAASPSAGQPREPASGHPRAPAAGPHTAQTASGFYARFKGQYSDGFDIQKDLQRIGVVNQTTMLASDTQAIADFLKQTMIETYGLTETAVDERFADTRDTLCYATLDNQSAVTGLLEVPADLAIVVGGYNSSNTSHLVELCEEKMPTYFISSEEKILSPQEILHYNFHKKEETLTKGWLPSSVPLRVLISSGASCPDALVEAVIRKLADYHDASGLIEKVTAEFADA